MKKMDRTGYYNESDKKQKNVLLLFTLILLGAVAGTALMCVSPKNQYFNDAIFNNGFVKSNELRTIIEVFIQSFKSTSILILILFFLGFCSISQPAEIAILFYRGMALGISIAATYILYGAKGFVVTLLMIVPHGVISSIILVLAVRESLRFSSSFMIMAFGKHTDDSMRPSVKLYIIRFLILTLFLVVSAAIDCALTYIFTGVLLK